VLMAMSPWWGEDHGGGRRPQEVGEGGMTTPLQVCALF